MASLEVYRTGSSARVDAFDWSSGSGPAAETAERVGIVSSVSNPIRVQSRLWGAVTVLSTSERLPDETEDRLERFSQLVATAIANAESRDAVSRTRQALELIAAEQAALRRVATLVAQGVAPAEIFAAVSAEVDQLFRLDVDTSDLAGVVRFDPGPELLDRSLRTGARAAHRTFGPRRQR
jgi:GAF domain-containing protein